MSLDNTRLLDFLGEVDKELKRKIVVVAVGGTAMTLLKAKQSTIDVDFTMPGEDFDEFKRVLKSIPHGFQVDTYKDGPCSARSYRRTTSQRAEQSGRK